jgi:hypothetical protein
VAETNNIYAIIKHILETYDGISSSDIDYNDIQWERPHWKAGRWVNKQKKSHKYLDEVCKHSFLSFYPTREGKRGIKAWRGDIAAGATHDETKILKDERGNPRITKFEKTPITKVYNDFRLNYDWNPGLKKYNKTLFITKTNESSFPSSLTVAGTNVSRSFTNVVINSNLVSGTITTPSDPSGWAEVDGYITYDDGSGNIVSLGKITGVDSVGFTIDFEFTNTYSITTGTYTGGTLTSHTTGILEWTTYVGGHPDYSESKTWWDICHGAYEETLVVNQLEYDCYWYIDNADFGEAGGSYNTVFYLMAQLLEWTTRQKYIVEYSLPINTTNLQLELCDPINFNDQIYTNSVDRLGWINVIKIIPTTKKPMITIQLILKPFNLEEYNLYVETGSAPDTITESGSQPDTITEGAQ